MSTKTLGFDSTAEEVVEGYNLTGKNIIVTGSNSGIGVETVRALAKVGATVFMTARNTEKAQSVLDDIVKSTGNKNVFLEQLELDSLDNVNDFVKRFLARDIPLHSLINNAGVMACPLSYTRDGFEMQFGTNHVGHFALTVGLLPALKAAKKSRVVNLSSTAHNRSDFDFEDYNFKTREYDTWASYGQSKTANVLFSVELTERYKKDGIFSNAVMPGIILTNLIRHNENLVGFVKNLKTKSIPGGASTTVWAAIAPEFEEKGGLYLENCELGKLGEKDEIKKNDAGYRSYAVDKENARKLWELSEKLIKKH